MDEKNKQVTSKAEARRKYVKPRVQTYTDQELRDRFSDVFLNAAFFADTHGSPGM